MENVPTLTKATLGLFLIMIQLYKAFFYRKKFTSEKKKRVKEANKNHHKTAILVISFIIMGLDRYVKWF